MPDDDGLPDLDDPVIVSTYTQRQSYHLIDDAGEPKCRDVTGYDTMPLRDALRVGGIDDREEDVCDKCAENYEAMANRNQEVAEIPCPECGEAVKACALHNHLIHHCEAWDPPRTDDGIQRRRWIG